MCPIDGVLQQLDQRLQSLPLWSDGVPGRFPCRPPPPIPPPTPPPHTAPGQHMGLRQLLISNGPPYWIFIHLFNNPTQRSLLSVGQRGGSRSLRCCGVLQVILGLVS